MRTDSGTARGTRLPWLAASIWGAAALTAALAYVMIARPTFPPQSDAWDYAQEARQILRGEGFTSLYTYPAHLGPAGPPFPVHWRMPLYAAVGALLLHAGVPLPFGFLVLGAFAHAILVALVFILAARLHSLVAGAAAASMAITCPLLLDSYNPGMSQVPAAALGFATWFLLLEGRGYWTAAGAALLGATAWYLRAESMVMVPLWFLAALLSGPMSAVVSSGAEVPSRNDGTGPARVSWRRGGWFLGIYAATVFPWLLVAAQSHGVASPIRGNPMLLYTKEFPGYSSARVLGVELPGALEYVLNHPLAFALRYVKDLLGYGTDLLSGLGPIAVGLGIAGLLLRHLKDGAGVARPAPVVRRPSLVLALGLAIPLHLGVLSALERSPRFLVPIVPVACVLLGVMAGPTLSRLKPRRIALFLVAVLIAERCAVVAFQRADAGRRFSPLPESLVAALQPTARSWRPQALVLTDVPDWVAWYLDRPALLLPMWRDLPTVLAERETAGILLSVDARGRNASDGDRDWIRIIDASDSIPGFEGPTVLPGGSRLYLPTRSPRKSPRGLH